MKSQFFVLAGVASLSCVALAQAPATTPIPSPTPTTTETPAPAPRKLPSIGVNVSSYFPTSSKARRTFGSSWTSIGFGFGSSLVAKAKVYPNFAFFRQKEDDDRLFAVAAGARYLTPIGKKIDLSNIPKYAPYAGIGLNLLYTDVNAPSLNIDDNGFGLGATATLGSTLGRTFFVEGRYSLFTRTADFNLSGAQLVVGARF